MSLVILLEVTLVTYIWGEKMLGKVRYLNYLKMLVSPLINYLLYYGVRLICRCR